MLLLVSQQNGVWGTTVEIPFWWHVATQIWVVVLIGRPIRSSTQIWILMHHKNGISVLIPQTSFLGETRGSILLAMLLLVSQQNGIWGTTVEIPFWWNVATQIWVVVLIGRPIRSSTQIWILMHHKNGISVLIPQTSFLGETRGSILKCGLFSQAFSIPDPNH